MMTVWVSGSLSWNPSAGYSKNHIQQVETAKTLPSVIALLDIAEALEIPPSKLFEFR